MVYFARCRQCYRLGCPATYGRTCIDTWVLGTAATLLFLGAVGVLCMATAMGCATPAEKRPKMGKCKHPKFGEYNCEIDTMGRPK